MALLDDDQLADALTGMSFPAHRWQMAAWADINCASSELREALRHLPDPEYASASHLRNTLIGIERRAAAPLRVDHEEHAERSAVSQQQGRRLEIRESTAVLSGLPANLRPSVTVG